MSTPFTSPADASWQTLLDEITTAYSERRQVIGQSSYMATDDKDVQAASYWATLQNWLETNYVSFIDHVSGPINPAETAFLYFTLATFRSAAGLNTSGFRRVPDGVEWDGVNDPVWSYGPMQAGDIIGPWIFEDLQKGFGTLRWSLRSIGYDSADLLDQYEFNAEGSGSSSDCPSNLAEYDAEYTAASWTKKFARWIVYFVFFSKADVYWNAQRVKTLMVIGGISSVVPHSVDLYAMPGAGEYFNTWWYDVDGLGMTLGKLWFYKSIAESSNTVHSEDFFDIRPNPRTELGVDCSSADGKWVCAILDTLWLLKWNFTNA